MKTYRRQVVVFWAKAIGVFLLVGSCMYFAINDRNAKIQKVLNSPPNYSVTDNTGSTFWIWIFIRSVY